MPEPIKIGYCPTRRDVFSREAAIQFRQRILTAISGFRAQIVDISGINEEGLLFEDRDLPAVIRHFRENEIDALFLPHCNFGSESLAAQTARALGVPVLLWGPRDDSPDEHGFRTRDSQCGLFATGKVLRRHRVPFTYLINSEPESKSFLEGYRRFLSVAAAVKAMRQMRILQIAPRPEPFSSVMCNESELLERFNIHLFPITLSKIVAQARLFADKPNEEVLSDAAFIRSISRQASEEDILHTAGLKAAMKKMAADYRCGAIAIQCWSALQEIFGIMPCLANSMLTEQGIPVACETDIHGAVTSLMIQAASGAVPFFADITIRHPEDDNAELLWHCGNFPYSLCRAPELASAGQNQYSAYRSFGIGEWELQPGSLTIARFDGDYGDYRLLIAEAHTAEGPKNAGNYVWIKTQNWPKWERMLVEGPYIHHVSAVYGSCGEILLEACKYLPGLLPDCVEPDREQLLMRWN